jgi:copper(I)-binding protein
MSFRFLLMAAAASCLVASAAQAHEYNVGDLHIAHPHARPSAPGQRSGGAYLTIENRGNSADRLVSASSPAAQSVEIHTMSMEGNVMKMREVGTIEVSPGEKVAMEPGKGYHLMLMNLKQPLQPGEKFPLTLDFEKAGKAEVSVTVDQPGSHGKGMPTMQH